MGIDWRGQIDALRRDGYRGWISLETLDRAEQRQVRSQHYLRKESSVWRARGAAAFTLPLRGFRRHEGQKT